uniref:NAI2-like protein n=2 Tax=Noccaea caerulescens TaxID=107243 RepID=A0A1J3G3G9_NOCCA
MTISAMGSKCVVLGLAVFLLLSSFHEVSCQAEGSSEFLTLDNQELQSNIFEGVEERQSIKKESESESSWEQNTTVNDKAKISSSLSEEIESEAVSGQSSSMMDTINREIEAHLGDLNKQSGTDGLVTTIGVDMGAFEKDAERRKQLEEIERQIKAAAATKVVEGTRKTKSTEETQEIKSEAASTISGQQSSTYNDLKKGNIGDSRVLGSLGISQSSGAWRCFLPQDKNGGSEEEDGSLIIPKYDIDAIIKEESISQDSKSSKTLSLTRSLGKIVNDFRNANRYRSVTTESSLKETAETVAKLKTTLKSYRNIKVQELVTRTDFEEILTMAARYEELSSASVSYISRLSMYRSVIKEGIKASQRVQLAQQRARLLKDMAMEKQKNVDAEFALVKSLAQRGDALYVKIFAIKKLVLKLEAEKEEVDVSFQKSVGNLSRVIEEASQAYEEYHVVVRKWKEEQATEEFSREAIESAEVVWVQFLSSL